MKKIVFRYFITFITGLLGGIILGATTVNGLISYRIDTYHEKIKILESTIEQRDVKLQKLEDSINKKKYILRDIEVYLVYEGIEEDNLDKIELEKHIKSKYKNFLGKEIKTIDVEIAAEVVDDKSVTQLDQNEYRLKVNKIVLTDIMKVWVVVKPSE